MTIFVVAGETSGDTIGAKVLKPLTPTVKIKGVIGPKLKEIGAIELFSIDSFKVMGIISILKHLPKLFYLFCKIRNSILHINPSIVLLIDNAEFSLMLAKSLRKHGYRGKIVQLVSPSVWAWRKSRIKTLENNFDLLLSIFPFEKKYFLNSPLRIEYVGHPLIDDLKNMVITNHLPLKNNKPIIAIFPGSRKKETSLNLPLQLEAVKDLTSHQIAISVSSKHLLPLIEAILKKAKVNATLVFPEERFELMKKAQFALSKLGTINLELAYFEVPTITSFCLPKSEQFILQYVFKVFLPHYSIVNLLLERRLFPEYVGSFATKENLKQEAFNFANREEIRKEIIDGCKNIKNIFKTEPFSVKASQIVSNLLVEI